MRMVQKLGDVFVRVVAAKVVPQKRVQVGQRWRAGAVVNRDGCAFGDFAAGNALTDGAYAPGYSLG